MNGVYVRRNLPRTRSGEPTSSAVLYYEHEEGLWHLTLDSLAKKNSDTEQEEDDDEDYYYTSHREKKQTHEWFFLDEFGHKRFRHDGDTIVPGAGTRWKHTSREQPSAPAAASSTATFPSTDSAPTGLAVVEVKPDDEEELPWQVRFG